MKKAGGRHSLQGIVIWIKEQKGGCFGVKMSERKDGLTEKEAQRRLLQDGENILKKGKVKSRFQIFAEQLKDPLIYVLLISAGLSVSLREYSDAMIICAVVLLNSFVGTIQEGKARKALDALGAMQSETALVIRGGKQSEIPASRLVCGDLVCLEAGKRVPADLCLKEAVHLEVEESALTGESQPVKKWPERMQNAMWKISDGQGNLFAKESDGEQPGRVFMSTYVTKGHGRGIVFATGMRTRLGQIADMIDREEEAPTPLQKRLAELGKILGGLSLFLCTALFVIALWQKRDAMQMLITAIALAVAAVPEGLPAVVTICLALSVTGLAGVNVIVRKLPAIETLGAVNVVCSDKTGTLTQNRMTVEKGYWNGEIHVVAEEAPPENLLRAMVLCNNATSDLQRGDPTELALMEAGKRFGMTKETEEMRYPRCDEIPFEAALRMMTTFHDSRDGKIGFRKGAPDEVVKACSYVWTGGMVQRLVQDEKKQILEAADGLSGETFRTLAAAENRQGDEEGGWIFLGLAAMRDPVRPNTAEAVELLRRAGVRTVMITGDHMRTALAVGRQIGIGESREQCLTADRMEELTEEELKRRLEHTRIFARVSPLQKLKIVKAFQSGGNLVAMTGDGVNDAPSLKAADIGIAMGKDGTDVAKQAADMILTDDRFETIERAIEEGRNIYENIRKSVIFLMSSNLGEVLTMFAAIAFGFPSPLKSSHILWINLITDSLPALALSVDQNDRKELMNHPPRKAGESLFARGGFSCTCFYGFLIAGISLWAFFLPVLKAAGVEFGAAFLHSLPGLLQKDPMLLAKAQTYAFTVLGMSQLIHAVGMKDVTKSVFRMKHTENRLMWVAAGTGAVLQLAVTEVPFLVKAFGTVPLDLKQWGELILISAVPLLAHEIVVLFQKIAFDPENENREGEDCTNQAQLDGNSQERVR